MADLNKLQHSSTYNYQQVYIQGTLNLNADTKSVNHDLGYIPYARRWGEQISGEISTLVVPALATIYHSAYELAPYAIDVKLTNTAFSATTLIGALKIYYRIYIDNSDT